ncbi:winged helix-turn-helix domain-containing protein [Saccharicrinis sp. FJH54]|uniref:winged helix-turn-helix domain-containing protein n=1 Tax=Saccharicrinis sp. FJH54 TaxID=3344665 RepID=UPI0035D50B3C
MTEIELLVNVKRDDNLLLTSDRAQLLKILSQTGSLLTASKALNISYNKTWLMLEELNKGLSKPLVYKSRGGKGGGGATITDYGQFILKEYELIENHVRIFVNKLNTEINL